MLIWGTVIGRERHFQSVRVCRAWQTFGGETDSLTLVKLKKKSLKGGQRMDLAARGQPVLASFDTNGATPARGGVALVPDAPFLDFSLVFTGETTFSLGKFAADDERRQRRRQGRPAMD